MGIAGLLNNYKLFDTNYYSMMAHLIPVCIVRNHIKIKLNKIKKKLNINTKLKIKIFILLN